MKTTRPSSTSDGYRFNIDDRTFGQNNVQACPTLHVENMPPKRTIVAGVLKFNTGYYANHAILFIYLILNMQLPQRVSK